MRNKIKTIYDEKFNKKSHFGNFNNSEICIRQRNDLRNMYTPTEKKNKKKNDTQCLNILIIYH